MRISKSQGHRRGFSFFEVVLVVAMLAVVGALANYGIRRSIARAKSAEARENVDAIARAAVQVFVREQSAEAAGSGANARQLCGSATNRVPTKLVNGTKYQPQTGAGADFNQGDKKTGWVCLGFGSAAPIYYQYSYIADGNYVAPNLSKAGAEGFEAAALGDLDGNGVLSTFARGGTVSAVTGELVMLAQIGVEKEFE